jgi:hypothetical protein
MVSNLKENIVEAKDPQIIRNNILKTLLYYDIFKFPLKDEEIYYLLPSNSIPKSNIINLIDKFSQDRDNPFTGKNGYYYVKPNEENIKLRYERERYSKKMWKLARIITHIIKRFPFVRTVIVTGSLSKNSSDKSSDLDFMVITKKDRLWIARTLLMLFKKIFLFNSYKFFCINYFISEDKLEIDEKNYFTATEIVHLKATFNTAGMNKFISNNSWIKKYFPNYIPINDLLNSAGFKVNDRKSYIQKLFELFFIGTWGNYLDNYFRIKTTDYFKRKYKVSDKTEHDQMFKSTKNESKTHPQNMQKQILINYFKKLEKYELSMDNIL